MVINKKYKGLIDEGWRYKIEGDIETTEELEIDLDKGLYVSGSIKTGEYIKAGGFIEAGEYIKAGGFIEAGWFIKAGGSIEAGEMIRADFSIEVQGEITIEDKEHKIFAGLYENPIIKCTKLNAEIGYGKLELIETETDDETEEAIITKRKRV